MEATRRRNVPMQVVDLQSSEIADLYARKFVLVRPDGHSAWRADAVPADPARLIDIIRGASLSDKAVGNVANANA